MASLVIGTACMMGVGMAFLGLKPVTERIAESQFRAATSGVEASLNALFQPADSMLAMAAGWLSGEAPDLDSPTAFNLDSSVDR